MLYIGHHPGIPDAGPVSGLLGGQAGLVSTTPKPTTLNVAKREKEHSPCPTDYRPTQITSQTLRASEVAV